MQTLNGAGLFLNDKRTIISTKPIKTFPNVVETGKIRDFLRRIYFDLLNDDEIKQTHFITTL